MAIVTIVDHTQSLSDWLNKFEKKYGGLPLASGKAAAYVGVTRAAVSARIKQGKLTRYDFRQGGDWFRFVSTFELDAWKRKREGGQQLMLFGSTEGKEERA